MPQEPEPPRRRHAPRVVWVSGAYGYGGDLVYFADVFAEFARHFPGGMVPVATDFPVARYPDLPLVPMLGFYRVGRTRRSVGGVTYVGVRRIPTLATALRIVRLRADVLILVEFSPTALMGFLIAKATRRKTVLLIESDPQFRGAPVGRISRAIKRRVARRVDVVQVSNRIGAEYVREMLGVDPARTLVGPYLTSSPAVPATAPLPQPAASNGSHNPPVRFLFLNSLTARKGLIELVDALNTMSPGTRGRWVLDVVGSGSEEPAVKERIREAGLGSHVIFHGRAAYSGTGTHYRAADIVVCPTLADYRSLGGFEAVNSARPVLISRYDGAHDEIIRHAPGARLIDPRDREGFAAALEELILDPAALDSARRAARQVPERFSLREAGENLRLAVYRAMSKRGEDVEQTGGDDEQTGRAKP